MKKAYTKNTAVHDSPTCLSHDNKSYHEIPVQVATQAGVGDSNFQETWSGLSPEKKKKSRAVLLATLIYIPRVVRKSLWRLDIKKGGKEKEKRKKRRWKKEG